MNLNYRIDYIPKDTPYNRRPGIAMDPDLITIHNTANPTSTANGEREWLENPLNEATASYHIVIDQNEAIEVIPLNEVAWHAGNKEGNMRSIGIEITESGNYQKTLENAEMLVAKMLAERGWETDRLRRHYDWSGKICPRKMYDDGTWEGWETFKADVKRILDSGEYKRPRVTIQSTKKTAQVSKKSPIKHKKYNRQTNKSSTSEKSMRSMRR